MPWLWIYLARLPNVSFQPTPERKKQQKLQNRQTGQYFCKVGYAAVKLARENGSDWIFFLI
jgi:hypothetical protein